MRHKILAVLAALTAASMLPGVLPSGSSREPRMGAARFLTASATTGESISMGNVQCRTALRLQP